MCVLLLGLFELFLLGVTISLQLVSLKDTRSLEMFHDRLVCAKATQATHDVGEITGNISEATG